VESAIGETSAQLGARCELDFSPSAVPDLSASCPSADEIDMMGK
jgi:hypothetical protein